MGEKERPDYYVVPSFNVYRQFRTVQGYKDYDSLTEDDKSKALDLVKIAKQNRLSAWKISSQLQIRVSAIRQIAQDNGIRLPYQRSTKITSGENFPFSFLISQQDETKYKEKWNLVLAD